MNILIVKHGALGDVIRTSYFAESLRLKYGQILKLFWITSTGALPLLESNPNIDLLTDNFNDLTEINFDQIFSLDDEDNVVESVSKLSFKKITGAIVEANHLDYTEDSRLWFDMGLLSKLGSIEADRLKKQNILGHSKIFQKIFGVNNVRPHVYFDNFSQERLPTLLLDPQYFFIGINPYAGGRWPSKELTDYELENLLKELSRLLSKNSNVKFVLFGAGLDKARNQIICDKLRIPSVCVVDTDESIIKFAKCISRMNLMITSDSLALHLSIAQGIPTLAFFAPTSATEIDNFGTCEKLISTSEDYCSYKSNADNSSITSKRIIKIILESVVFASALKEANIMIGS
jgi:heptosyltransferase-2